MSGRPLCQGGALLRLLITGGAGFIGRNLTDRFAGHDVHVLDNLSTGTEPRPWASLHVADLRDAARVGEVVRHARPDLVIHAAAQVSVARSVEEPAFDRAVNYEGTLNLLEALADLPQRADFVFLSTCAIYGTTTEPDEDTPPDPLSPYAENKLRSEEVILQAGHVRPLILRLANIYGIGQRPPAMVPAIVAAAVGDHAFRLEGDGSQERDLLHVRDLGRAIELLMNRESRSTVYTVGGGSPIRLLDLLEVAQRAFGRPLVVERVPPRRGDVHLSRPRTTRLAAAGFFPAVPLVDGLREIWDHVAPAQEKTS